MQKLMKAALAAKFGVDNAEVLTIVCQATGNPVTAAEMLLGCYERPQLQPLPSFRIGGKSDISIVSFDPLAQEGTEILIEYRRHEGAYVWVPRDSTGDGDDLAVHLDVPTGDWDKLASSLDVSVETARREFSARNVYKYSIPGEPRQEKISVELWERWSALSTKE